VKNIVTNHLGTVSVWSSPGSGSTFTIRLPRVHSDRPSSAMFDISDDGVPVRTGPATAEDSLL
jgi:two-component system sensor histidine kinase SenX3